MNVSARHLPWIGGTAEVAPGTAFSPLVSPIDATVASHFVESDAAIIDAAVKHAHAAYVKHQDASVAKRVEWLMAAADAIDKIEGALIASSRNRLIMRASADRSSFRILTATVRPSAI